ncbi:hypothetical protein [Roseateles sp.]|uniref:hypothetical protein n=1 Tax=Roseateles sp. TaxID=1971397 RepID=UPI0025D3A526|nr:hypothetical protein [Roseateles sp.]MBV8035946.1 hypothetical protein [Roseateles sp.]
MSKIDDNTPTWLLPARAEFARLRPEAGQDAALLARLTDQQRLLRDRRRCAEMVKTAEAHEPRWLRRLAWGGGALGATAAVLLSAMLLLDPPDIQAARVTPAGSGFIPLVPEGELRQALAAGRGAAVWLQPTELPRERLALLGLPFDAARADETVHAELMLDPGGQLLAVRILN